MARTLIVGYDESSGSAAALDAALELATETGDSLVIAFGYEPPGGVGEEKHEMGEAVRELGERVTQSALERAKDAGVDAEVALVKDSPVDALIALGNQHDARMIVVGSAGEGPLKGAILGSTPHALLPAADRPVLVVRAQV